MIASSSAKPAFGNLSAIGVSAGFTLYWALIRLIDIFSDRSISDSLSVGLILPNVMALRGIFLFCLIGSGFSPYSNLRKFNVNQAHVCKTRGLNYLYNSYCFIFKYYSAGVATVCMSCI